MHMNCIFLVAVSGIALTNAAPVVDSYLSQREVQAFPPQSSSTLSPGDPVTIPPLSSSTLAQGSMATPAVQRRDASAEFPSAQSGIHIDPKRRQNEPTVPDVGNQPTVPSNDASSSGSHSSSGDNGSSGSHSSSGDNNSSGSHGSQRRDGVVGSPGQKPHDGSTHQAGRRDIDEPSQRAEKPVIQTPSIRPTESITQTPSIRPTRRDAGDSYPSQQPTSPASAPTEQPIGTDPTATAPGNQQPTGHEMRRDARARAGHQECSGPGFGAGDPNIAPACHWVE